MQSRKLLSRIDARVFGLRGAEGLTVGELLGLILIDLDRLSSREAVAEEAPADFAVEYMDRRLARRLAEKYSFEAVGQEIDRRFASAIAGGDGARDPALRPLLARLEHRLAELTAALKAGRRSS